MNTAKKFQAITSIPGHNRFGHKVVCVGSIGCFRFSTQSWFTVSDSYKVLMHKKSCKWQSTKLKDSVRGKQDMYRLGICVWGWWVRDVFSTCDRPQTQQPPLRYARQPTPPIKGAFGKAHWFIRVNLFALSKISFTEWWLNLFFFWSDILQSLK